MADTGSKQRLKTYGIAAAGLFAALVCASYFIYGLLDTGEMHPVALLALAAALSIAIPMARANFFPSRRDLETEYAFHEQRLAKEIEHQISAALGPEAWQRLFAGPGQCRETAVADIQTMLGRHDTRANPDLQFALLLALARCWEASGDPESAAPLLTSALEIRPGHFMARMHLAAICEWTGAVEEAARHYRRLLDHPRDLSIAMQKLVAAKIKQITAD